MVFTFFRARADKKTSRPKAAVKNSIISRLTASAFCIRRLNGG